jgi:hypothetical protein
MAIAESVPAANGAAEPSLSRRRRLWLRRVLLALGALLAAAVVVLWILAGTYQPVHFGDSYGGSFAGLPAGTGLRSVNTFGGVTGEIYVPEQSGVFSVLPSIFNTGPETVTIEAVSILSPQDRATATQGITPWPLIPAGSVRWAFQYSRPGQEVLASGTSVVGVKLPPGQGMMLGIPLRMSGICYDPNGWTGTDVFYVKERFLFFTHWAAIQFQPNLVMNEPFNPGGNDTEPAKYLICPAGTSKPGEKQ